MKIRERIEGKEIIIRTLSIILGLDILVFVSQPAAPGSKEEQDILTETLP